MSSRIGVGLTTPAASAVVVPAGAGWGKAWATTNRAAAVTIVDGMATAHSR